MSDTPNLVTDLPTTEQWLKTGKFFSFGDYKLFYRDDGGDKPAILLIHGFPTSSWDWAKLWPLLEHDYRLIAPDMLGFGFSDKPGDHEYSIMEQADAIEALVDTLKLDKFHVLAHDYGDTVAQELLYRQNTGRGAGHWLSLCLLNGGLFPETHRARLIQKLLLSPLGPVLCRLVGQSQFELSMKAVFGRDTQPSQFELDGFWRLMRHNNGNLLLYRLIRYMVDRREHRERWLLALRDSCVPVSLINGSVDPVSGAHMVARYRELVRRGDIIIELPTIGHYPQCEAPEDVAMAYRNFLQGDSLRGESDELSV